MKKTILMGSAVFVLMASSFGMGTVLLSNDAAVAARMLAASGILGLTSIGLFFVGLALKE